MNTQEVFRDIDGVVHLIFWHAHNAVLMNCQSFAHTLHRGEGVEVGHTNCIMCITRWSKFNAAQALER